VPTIPIQPARTLTRQSTSKSRNHFVLLHSERIDCCFAFFLFPSISDLLVISSFNYTEEYLENLTKELKPPYNEAPPLIGKFGLQFKFIGREKA